MSEQTKITWCHHTFNPWWGCTKVSAGCANCYADVWAKRTGYDVFGPDTPRRFFGEKHRMEPLRWNKKAAAAGERRRVFCGSMCDVFDGHDIQWLGGGLNLERLHLFDMIEETPSLDWLLLTKRPQNMINMAPAAWAGGWPENVWAMATVENQDMAAPRIEALLNVPAKVRGISLEPLLGPVTFRWAKWCPIPYDKVTGETNHLDGLRMLDWLIIGCEKLPGGRPGRPCKLEWVRELVAQARTAGVAVFVKQIEINGRVSADPSEWPEDLRIQEFP